MFMRFSLSHLAFPFSGSASLFQSRLIQHSSIITCTSINAVQVQSDYLQQSRKHTAAAADSPAAVRWVQLKTSRNFTKDLNMQQFYF